MDALINLGGLQFRWFGTIISLGIIVGLFFIWCQTFIYRESFKPFLEILIYTIPLGLICARLVYVGMYWQWYAENPLEILLFWHPGLSVYGALLGLVLVLRYFSRKTSSNFWYWADRIAPGLAIGQAIGQWANLGSQESFGYPTTHPWGIYIDYAFRPVGFENYDFFQPIFLYHSIWNFAIFILLIAISYTGFRFRKYPQGVNFLLYLLLYAIGNYIFDGMKINAATIMLFPRLLSLFFGIAAAYCLMQVARPRTNINIGGHHE